MTIEARRAREQARRKRVAEVGESFKAFTNHGRIYDVPRRAAERAYRRGFHQGVYIAMTLLRDDGGTLDDLIAYERVIREWRTEGAEQDYKIARIPPDPRK